MAKRTTSKASRKQERQDARPFAHRTGRWAKKCRGAFIYLGKVADDPTGEAAWNKWLEIRDDARAGRTPRANVAGLTVETLANKFLDAKLARVTSGEMGKKTWEDYQQMLRLVVETLGRGRAAADVQPGDWAKLRAAFSARWGAGRLVNAVTCVRGVWKWAYENDLLATPMKFGSGFARPNAKAIRAVRNARGDRTFKAEDVHAILGVASPNMRAALLLGLNCGYGTGDIASMPLSALDLEGDWSEFPRPKTAIRRRCPLWAETITAIKAAITSRPEPKRGAEHLLFLRNGIHSHGTSYMGNGSAQMSIEFSETCKAAGVSDKTFYDARRTFQTIGETSKDFPAVSAIMGHAPSGQDMSATYRQRIDDSRLVAVVAVVHSWLYGVDGQDGGRKPDARKHAQKATQPPVGSTPIARAVMRCMEAIASAEGPDKTVLRSVWNESEIALALSGESWTVERFLRTWGGAQDQRPQLRVVGA